MKINKQKISEPSECHCRTSAEHLPPVVGHDLLLPICPPYKDDQSPEKKRHFFSADK